MHARFILIAASLLSTSGFAAEPAKPAPQPPAQPESATPKVVLASAEVRTPQPAEQQPAARPKRRLMRVTGCRCGDQEAQPEE